MNEFLKEVNVDGLDIFALPTRHMVFANCWEKSIAVLTAAPLGMGAAFLYVNPMGMGFENHFKVEGHGPQEQDTRLIAGLSPAMLNRDWLVAPEAVNFQEQRGPSTILACDMCAGVMGEVGAESAVKEWVPVN